MLLCGEPKGNGTVGRRWNQWLAWLYARVPALARYAAAELDALAGTVPWAVARVPLERASVGLVTLAGVHLRAQPPFDMTRAAGDASFRIIPAAVSVADLMITHDYYDHAAADRDPNVVFPLTRLHEFAAAGRIDRVAPHHVGAMGHVSGAEERRLVAESAPAIARGFQADGVDYVILVPG
jgi:D-proline reductase (dithiol) PrdB